MSSTLSAQGSAAANPVAQEAATNPERIQSALDYLADAVEGLEALRDQVVGTNQGDVPDSLKAGHPTLRQTLIDTPQGIRRHADTVRELTFHLRDLLYCPD